MNLAAVACLVLAMAAADRRGIRFHRPRDVF